MLIFATAIKQLSMDEGWWWVGKGSLWQDRIWQGWVEQVQKGWVGVGVGIDMGIGIRVWNGRIEQGIG